MTAERTALAQMLWDLKGSGDGLSYSKMAARSGGLVAVSTLHSVMSGGTKNLTPATIAGLARILRVSEAHVLAALKNESLSAEESTDEERRRLWAMYSDIPRQCQKDVMDLLEVLQRNHSISARKERQSGRRNAVAGPTRVAHPLDSDRYQERRELGEKPILPAKHSRRSKAS